MGLFEGGEMLRENFVKREKRYGSQNKENKQEVKWRK